MKITKLGHCCLVVEVKSSGLGKSPLAKGVPNSDSGRVVTTPAIADSGTPFLKGDREDKPVRIMTDPGAYSSLQNEAKGIDYIFITHEHQDHCHLESLKKVLSNNKHARIITNNGVGKLLDEQKIQYELLEHGGVKDFSGISVEGHGEKHASIYQDFGQVQNTGYLFANRFFYPGDAFYLSAEVSAQAGKPQKPVEILALPVAGPWMKISEAIDYAKLLKPKVCFPVHDGMLKFNQPTRAVPQKFLTPLGIGFVDILEGATREF